MKILGHRPIRGPNMYHERPVWVVVVEAVDVDSGSLAQTLKAAGLEGVRGDNLGQMLAATCVALQRGVGLEAAYFDAWLDADGDWFCVHDYQHEHAGEAAGPAARDLIREAIAGNTPDVQAALARVEAAVQKHAPEPGLGLLLEEARRRGIPVNRRGDQHYQLGWGSQQKALWGTMTSEASGLGFDIANDHERVLEFFEDTGIPTPVGDSRRTLAGCEELAEELRYPVTVKPLRGRGGVTVRVDDASQLEAAYDKAKQFHNWVVLADTISGTPHRVLVVAGKVIGAARKDGDGDHATWHDVTDTLHPAVRSISERAARLVGLDVVGIDIVGPDLATDPRESRAKVVSLHPTPDITPFADRGAAAAVMDTLFPQGQQGRIPLVGVTGTNGKTTTVRLVSHILKMAGHQVGMACTGTIEVEHEVILRGDYSGPSAARTVLQEPHITAAVCEVARGGILRRGLGFDQADATAFLNVGSDHLGQGGIDTIDDLANLKSVVVRATKPGGAVVLNADDARVWAQRTRLEGRRIIPFTLEANNPDVEAHLSASPDNAAVVFADDALWLKRGPASFRVVDVHSVPITLGGAARFNIANAAAAIGLAYGLGVSEDDCRMGLRTFNPNTSQLPGRMNLLTLGGVKVLIDYGHNVPALQALAATLPRLAAGRKINVADAAGNRRDQDLRAFGTQIASMYDRIIVCDPDPRGRKHGATADVVIEGIRAAGFPEDALTRELDEGTAVRMALAEARPGDLVVLQADDVQGTIDLCNRLRERLEAGESPGDLNEELLSV